MTSRQANDITKKVLQASEVNTKKLLRIPTPNGKVKRMARKVSCLKKKWNIGNTKIIAEEQQESQTIQERQGGMKSLSVQVFFGVAWKGSSVSM